MIDFSQPKGQTIAEIHISEEDEKKLNTIGAQLDEIGLYMDYSDGTRVYFNLDITLSEKPSKEKLC